MARKSNDSASASAALTVVSVEHQSALAGEAIPVGSDLDLEKPETSEISLIVSDMMSFKSLSMNYDLLLKLESGGKGFVAGESDPDQAESGVDETRGFKSRVGLDLIDSRPFEGIKPMIEPEYAESPPVFGSLDISEFFKNTNCYDHVVIARDIRLYCKELLVSNDGRSVSHQPVSIAAAHSPDSRAIPNSTFTTSNALVTTHKSIASDKRMIYVVRDLSPKSIDLTFYAP